MQLKGLHHISALTADAKKNLDFYTNVLGMRLVKKTVNQDDTSVYHLFYGDGEGSPGSELTFFEIPRAGRTHKGSSSISAVSLTVPGREALEFWEKRFSNLNVDHSGIHELGGRQVLTFRDPENLEILLTSDGKIGKPWNHPAIPDEFAVTGLGPVTLTVRKPEKTERVLVEILGFQKISEEDGVSVFSTGNGGAAAEVRLLAQPALPAERLGRGGVHHAAFRTDSEEELQEWEKKINEAGFHNSGIVDRFYFKALYFREPNGILFELSTDGPGFAADENLESLGRTLALPPFLESKRAEIEAKLKPLQ